MMKYSVYSLLCVCLLGALTACDPEISDPFITQSQAAVDERIIVDYLSENKLTAQRTASGIYYRTVKEGSGNLVAVGDSLRVHYAGKVIYRQEFDNSRLRNETLGVRVGAGKVIPGWDEGLQFGRKGAQMQLYIPSAKAYGTSGRPPHIPINAVLVFDIEVVELIRQ